MIITELAGGLGNQMFQYAAGRYLAHKNQVPLCLDTNYLLDRSYTNPDFVFRDFDLAIWQVETQNATNHQIEKLTGVAYAGKETTTSIWKKAYKKIKNALTPPKKHIYREPHFHFDPNFEHQKAPCYLQGYWQSEKYFAPIANILRQEFTFREPLSQNCLPLLTQIESNQSICLNVRRGDFVNIKKTNDLLGFVGLPYLYAGVNYMTSKIEKPHFFVFSDEIAWCQENIKIDFPITFVTHDYAGKKFKDYLALMTHCKHFIIPNSTFAWWAAWLAQNPEKIIISPKKWFADEKINSKDLIPDTWIRL
jgi:hypothetical protein